MATRERKRRGLHVPAWFIVALTCLLVLTDLVSARISQFWVEHPMFSGLISGAALLVVTVIVVDGILKKREQRRLSTAAQRIGRALTERASRGLESATIELRQLQKDLEAQRREAAEAKRAEDHRWRNRVKAFLKLLNPRTYAELLNPRTHSDGSAIIFDPIVSAVVALFTPRDTSERPRVAEVIARHTMDFEIGLAAATPFLSATDDGLHFVDVGFELIQEMRNSENAQSVDKAIAWLAGDQVQPAMEKLRTAESQLGMRASSH